MKQISGKIQKSCFMTIQHLYAHTIRKKHIDICVLNKYKLYNIVLVIKVNLWKIHKFNFISHNTKKQNFIILARLQTLFDWIVTNYIVIK
jgi:hypothetical protein